MSKPLILASRSKRRIEILQELNLNFISVDSQAKEIKADGKHSIGYLVKTNARLKAEIVLKRFPENCILAADTLVSCNGKIFEKPLSKKHGLQMFECYLKNRSYVWTALCFYNPRNKTTLLNVTKSSIKAYSNFSPATRKKLFSLVFEPKASGGFSIEGLGALFLDNIQGSFYNILGLPVHDMLTLIEESGYSFFSFLRK